MRDRPGFSQVRQNIGPVSDPKRSFEGLPFIQYVSKIKIQKCPYEQEVTKTTITWCIVSTKISYPNNLKIKGIAEISIATHLSTQVFSKQNDCGMAYA